MLWAEGGVEEKRPVVSRAIWIVRDLNKVDAVS